MTIERQQALIEAQNITRVFRAGAEEVNALRGVSISIRAGCFVLLRGRSGSGKTTLLNLLGGLDRPTGGTVKVNGHDLHGMSGGQRNRWRRDTAAFVFQALALLPGLTALENVDLPLRIAGVDPRTAAARAREQLERVGLGPRAHHRVFELSGGEQQRVAVARALVKQPTVLFADEPTGELDQGSGATVLQLLRSAVEERRMTAVVTSHDHLATGYADLVYAMADGVLHRVEPSREGSA
ncbi:MAG: ABC transporter ATP-binding protein [Spirochaetaceae bacterium]|nr:ABC transporter ATP-binding protein [Spirochaetaceae bacterium]